MRSINLFILFGIRMYCQRNGRGQSLCLFIKRLTKQTVKYRGIFLLLATYKTLSYIVLSSLTPNVEEINGDNQCGFGCNRSTADHIICIHGIVQKKMRIKQSSVSAIYRLHESLCMIQLGGRSCITFLLRLVFP